MTGSTAGLSALYDDLARWQWGRRDRVGTAMRKRLLPSEEEPAAAEALDSWLLDLAEMPRDGSFLDVGCGFGLTAIRWALARADLEGIGLTISGWQADRAREEVAAAGLSQRVSVLNQSFERPPAGPFDAIVSIESLSHAADLPGTLSHLADSASRSCRLLVVEDIARDDDVERTAEGRRLRVAWATERLWSEASWRAALSDAGWAIEREFDLTARVPARSGSRPIWPRRLGLTVARAVASGARRRVCDAFLGGLALESLYAGDLMSYRALVCSRVEHPA